MGEIRWIEDSEIIKRYTHTTFNDITYFIERKNQPKILRRISHNEETGLFRVEVIDDLALRNRIMQSESDPR